MAETDDLDALALPEPRQTLTLAGQTVHMAPLTLARFAAGRRFARQFAACLAAADARDAIEASRAALLADFAAATGVEREAIDRADAAEAVAAFFALTGAVRDFSAGPLAAALIGGLDALVPADRTAAQAGESSSPGSSPAATG